VVTRRALLGAGGVALLAAGCGPPEEPEIVPEDVLREQLRLSRAVVAAYAGVAEAGPLRTNAQARARRLEDALRELGAATETPPPAGAGGPEAALAAESAALRAHVAAVGLLGERRWRELLSGLVAGAAAGESGALALLGRPAVPESFPGQPVA
jgi:hypothetical protein